MIGDKSVLALIPARGGSKGVPRKNIRPAGGKPLIAWTIEAAKASRYIDRLILSTDDPSIAAVARHSAATCRSCGRPSLRPTRPTAWSWCGTRCNRSAERYDYLVLLQPTSPLRDCGRHRRCDGTLCASARRPRPV